MINIQEKNTSRNTLRWAIDTLKNSNIESPSINAEVLLAHALSCDRIELHTNPDKIINDGDTSKYKRIVYERANHVPLQYITGHVEFMSLDFVEDERDLFADTG